MNTLTDKIMLIDDDAGIATSTEMVLSDEYHFHHASNAGDALQYLSRNDVKVILLDIHMPGTPTEQILSSILTISPNTQVIMFTASNDINDVVRFIKLGAFSYLVKGDHSNKDLRLSVKSAVKNFELLNQRSPIKTAKEDRPYYLSTDPQMLELLSLAKKLSAAENLPILITGETGVGKERLAEYIHSNSPRKNGPLVSVNCGAIPENLIESELFGHEKGAFTDATETRKGCFEHAQGGTLFLDEIGCMKPELQVRLLRVLQEKTVQRVGSQQSIPLDIRVISATNENLNRLIQSGRFRQDLFFRINGIELKIPPLRERPTDIEGLFRWFMDLRRNHYGNKSITIEDELLSLLKFYSWPGNSRELETLVEVLLALTSDGEKIGIRTLPGEWFSRLSLNYNDIKNLSEEEKRERISIIIDACNGNVSLAAKLLGVDRSTLYRALNIE